MADLEQPKRGRGRPKGSVTKTDVAKKVVRETQSLYRDIHHMLTPEQREYFELAFKGQAEFDSVMESELFLRYFSVYMTKLLSSEMDNKGVLKDMGSILGQYNTAIKTLEEMKMKRLEMEMKKKNGNDSGVVDTARESALGRVQGILEKYPVGRTG